MFIAQSYYFSPKNQTQNVTQRPYNDNLEIRAELQQTNKVFLFDIWLDLGGN